MSILAGQSHRGPPILFENLYDPLIHFRNDIKQYYFAITTIAHVAELITCLHLAIAISFAYKPSLKFICKEDETESRATTRSGWCLAVSGIQKKRPLLRKSFCAVHFWKCFILGPWQAYTFTCVVCFPSLWHFGLQRWVHYGQHSTSTHGLSFWFAFV